jgi:hypothetical protein
VHLRDRKRTEWKAGQKRRIMRPRMLRVSGENQFGEILYAKLLVMLRVRCEQCGVLNITVR